MHPRERFLAVLRGEPVDRVPLELYGFWYPDRAALDAVDDPLKRKIGERLIDRMTYRTIVPSHVNRFLVTPPQRISERMEHLSGGGRVARGEIDTPKGKLTFVSEYDPRSDTVWTVKYPVETRADVDAIMSVPWELPADLRPPADEDFRGDFSERGICETGISSPMVCVGGMMSYQSFLELCITDLELAKELTRICLDRAMDVLKVLLSKPGVDLVWIGGSEWLTPPMGSPALYDALVQEQERAIVDYVHANSTAVTQVHCHGKIGTVLEKTIARGADYTEPVEPPPDGDITLAEAKTLAAGRITLGGNIECRILVNEPADVVDRAVRAAFEGGKDRFVLVATAGCSPRISDREFHNYMKLIDVWEELSEI